MDIEALANRLYEERKDAWDEALRIVNGWLKGQCKIVMREWDDQSRLVCEGGRIKDLKRTIEKVRRKGFDEAEMSSHLDVEQKITDIVATKVLCKSTRDQQALSLYLQDTSGKDIRKVHDAEDFVANPKESGYRGIHFSYIVPIPEKEEVRVELQIKTRLQDAWSELTHEDMYKPSGALRPRKFHDAVAIAMANLLAEVDRLADQLADDLDETVERLDGGTSSTLHGEAPLCENQDHRLKESEALPVVVRTVGPRYALAVDGEGNEGIILAADVRKLLVNHGRVKRGEIINVDEYLGKKDQISVVVRKTPDGRVFQPLTLPDHFDE